MPVSKEANNPDDASGPGKCLAEVAKDQSDFNYRRLQELIWQQMK
jgi:hypothetical protein